MTGVNDKKRKLAIIGASYLQLPLINKAKAEGIETHVFAWAAGDVGEKAADFFYPISIVEKDKIYETCKGVGIDGICSIASDLASVTVNYVANRLGLICNSPECVLKSTNKNLMRKCFEEGGDPSPKSILVENIDDLAGVKLEYPVIVKPLDRSGSRGITKLDSPEGLGEAIEAAKECGFIKKALVEEYVGGDEYSVEYISWKGKHTFLAITRKYTTGAPHFIETGHMEPAPVTDKMTDGIKAVVEHALSSLGIEYGASHSEVKVDKNGNVKIIEIGGRMGGDFIGSHLVELSTGVDFVKAVIDVALGVEPSLVQNDVPCYAGVRFVFSKEDVEVLSRIKDEVPDILYESNISGDLDEEVTDSSNRHGYFIVRSDNKELVEKYLG